MINLANVGTFAQVYLDIARASPKFNFCAQVKMTRILRRPHIDRLPRQRINLRLLAGNTLRVANNEALIGKDSAIPTVLKAVSATSPSTRSSFTSFGIAHSAKNVHSVIAFIQPCELTEAACTLIASQWRGDKVIFAGDYLSFGESKNQNHSIELMNTFGSYPYESCYDGGYEKLLPPNHITRYRYAINESKREYIDRDNTSLACVCEIEKGRFEWNRYDPIPALFSPNSYYDDGIRGRWCLDEIRMSQEPPDEEYNNISGCWVCWSEILLLSDEEIRKAVYSEAFKQAIIDDNMRREGEDIELHGAVDAIARIIEEECP